MDYEKYDDYDAYNLDRTSDLEEFIDSHVDYMLAGGCVGLPITFLGKHITGPDHMLEIVDSARLAIDGKVKYQRIIVKFSDYYINALKAIFEGGTAMTTTTTEKDKRAAEAAAKRDEYWNGTCEHIDFDATQFWRDHRRISDAVAACIDRKHWVKSPWAETPADTAKEGTKYVFSGIDMQKVKLASGTGVWLWPDELTDSVLADLRAMTLERIEDDIEKNIAHGAVTSAGILARRIRMAVHGMPAAVWERIAAMGQRAWLIALKAAADVA